MMGSGLNLIVVAVVALNIVACVWLMWWTAHMRNPSGGHAAKGATEKTGHVWDGDLEEFNNPLPRWWLGLFILTVIFAVGYLLLYPGMGNYAGMRGWSSQRQLDVYLEQQRAAFDERLSRLNDKSSVELAADASAMSTARNLFSANCSGCHGSDGRGARGFPNLADQDWLYGGDEATIKETITHGRHGVMPALGPMLGDTGVNEVASYVLSLSGVEAPADWVAAGHTRFATICAACHGADAKGNPALGAPNLTDKIWLHGGDFASVKATVTNGRNSQMPAQEQMLGEKQIRLLTAYVLNLSRPQSRVASTAAGSESDHVAAP